MTELKRLASRTNFREVEKEWQYEFVQYVIASLGLPEEVLNSLQEECFPENYSDFNVNHRISLRKYLSTFDIYMHDKNKELEIYLKNSGSNEPPTLLAKWGQSIFNLKNDPREIDPNNKFYIEIIANPWTIFDEQ